MIGWRTAAKVCGVLLAAGAAVVINLPDHPDPSEHVEGARGEVVPGLHVVNDDYDRWFIPQVRDVRPDAIGGVVSFTFVTGICDKQGLVGYAEDLTADVVRLTVVAGESGKDCDDVAVGRHGEFTLDEPIGGRRVVVVRPTWEGPEER